MTMGDWEVILGVTWGDWAGWPWVKGRGDQG